MKTMTFTSEQEYQNWHNGQPTPPSIAEVRRDREAVADPSPEGEPAAAPAVTITVTIND